MKSLARRIALSAALCLPALSAGAFPLDFGWTHPEIEVSRPIRGGYYDVNQDTAALFLSGGATSQSFSIDDTIFFGILGAQASGAALYSLPMYYSAAPSTPAPEPTALALFAASLALLGLRSARR